MNSRRIASGRVECASIGAPISRSFWPRASSTNRSRCLGGMAALFGWPNRQRHPPVLAQFRSVEIKASGRVVIRDESGKNQEDRYVIPSPSCETFCAAIGRRTDRIRYGGVAEWPPRSSDMSRIGRLAIAGKLAAGSSPNEGYGFQCHVSSTLDCPLVVLFE
jgi:hypothetical protein